jgi:hypothetical protein
MGRNGQTLSHFASGQAGVSLDDALDQRDACQR